MKSSPPHPTTGFVPFVSIKVINPLAATKGRAGAGSRMTDLYNPPRHFQELILRRNWDTWAKIDLLYFMSS